MPHVNDLSDQALFYGELMKTRRALVRSLVANGGAVTSASGRATAELFDDAGVEMGNDARAGLMKTMEQDGWIVRDVRGKRTFEIALMNDHPAVARLIDFMLAEAAQEDELAEAQSEAERLVAQIPVGPPDWEEVETDPVPDAAPTPTADEVATAILRKVSRLLDAEVVDVQELNERRLELANLRAERDRALEERDEYSARLSATVEENQRLRRMNREAADELSAVKLERDRLRREKKALEDNLKAAMKGASGEVDYEVRRRIEAFMRQAPTTRGGD